MFRKTKTAAPFFREPTPYNPLTGVGAPLTEPHPYMFGKVSTEITARDGITPGIGYVTLYILKTGKVDMFETTKNVQVRSVRDVAVEVDEYVLLLVDEYTRYWAVVGPGPTTSFKPKCRFTANEDFDTTDEWVEGTINDDLDLDWGTDQYGQGTLHPETGPNEIVARFYNLLTHTPDVYEFYGDADDAGIASFSHYTEDTVPIGIWFIDMFECP